MIHLKFKTYLAFLLLLSITIVFCKTPRKTASSASGNHAPMISYEKDISPIMVRSCTPCHFPEEGKKKLLNTYEATKGNIVDILNRIQLPVSDIKFMPFKSKKAPLTTAEIKLIKDWATQNMPK